MDDKAMPIAGLSNAITNKETDEAIWRTARLHLHNVRSMKPGTKDFTMAVTALGKLLIEIKKLSPKEIEDKDELLNELDSYLKGE